MHRCVVNNFDWSSSKLGNALSLSGVAEAGADGVAMDAPTGGEMWLPGLMDADTLYGVDAVIMSHMLESMYLT